MGSLGYSSTYTPSYIAVDNIASIGNTTKAIYFCVGDMVSVFGNLSMAFTNSLQIASFRISLPIAITDSAINSAPAGFVSSDSGTFGDIKTNDSRTVLATIRTTGSGLLQTLWFSFTYKSVT